jgi:hypothetical protein
MRQLSAHELLDAWESAVVAAALERPLILLAAATNRARDEIAEWSIGARNAQLLALRARVFGDEMNAVAHCPVCGERLEMNLRVSDFSAPPPDDSAPPTRALRVNGHTLIYRLPNTHDLLAAQAARDFETARETLLRRVVVSVSGAPELDATQIAAHAVDALSAQLERDDPLAALRVHLTCPNCQHEWETALEIAQFVWLELDAWAKRILREVHTLASAYGWSENEILALSPQRRQLYLEMIAS